MMEAGEKFKKAIVGGFDKADVMHYFEKTQKKHREEVSALKEELQAVQQKASALQEQCGDQSDTLQELTEETRALRGENSSLSEQLAQLQKKGEELQRELSSQKALNTELTMKKSVLSENLRRETAKNAELKEELADITARFAERTGISIGELLIEAQINAKKIIEKAKADAEEVRVGIGTRCEEAQDRFSGLNDQLGGVEEHFRTVADETIAELERVRGELTGIREAFALRAKETAAETKALNADQSLVPSAEDYMKK